MSPNRRGYVVSGSQLLSIRPQSPLLALNFLVLLDDKADVYDTDPGEQLVAKGAS